MDSGTDLSAAVDHVKSGVARILVPHEDFRNVVTYLAGSMKVRQFVEMSIHDMAMPTCCMRPMYCTPPVPT